MDEHPFMTIFPRSMDACSSILHNLKFIKKPANGSVPFKSVIIPNQ
jgi:hypothetical protein